jgi:hypothetical protein
VTLGLGRGWSASEFVKPRAWRQLGPTALLGSTTRRLTSPCWHWDLPISDRPLLHDCMPHRAHFERQVSHYVRRRIQGTPAQPGEGEEKSRTPPEGPARQLWPATLAGPSHEVYVGGRRPGDIPWPAAAQYITMKEQTLCHCAGTDRDNRGPEATPASCPNAAARCSRPHAVQKLPGSPPTRRSFLN